MPRPTPARSQPAHAARERLDQRRRRVADAVGDQQQVARRVLGRHEDQLGEAAGMDAGALERVAQRLVAARGTARTSPHGTWWWTKTRSPGAGSSASTGARCDHDADRLVPEHERRARLDVPLHQVAAADPARAHRHEHLARPGLRRGRSSIRTSPPRW